MRREHQTPEPPRDSPFKGKEPIPMPLGMSTKKETPPRHIPPECKKEITYRRTQRTYHKYKSKGNTSSETGSAI